MNAINIAKRWKKAQLRIEQTATFGRQSNKITYNRKGHNIDIWMSTYISECCVNVCGMNERDVTERSEIARGVRKESSWKARMVIRKGQKSS